jgi:hypothetical protein
MLGFFDGSNAFRLIQSVLLAELPECLLTFVVILITHDVFGNLRAAKQERIAKILQEGTKERGGDVVMKGGAQTTFVTSSTQF